MAKKQVERGGVIPYYIENGEIYMMFMKPSNPKFGGDVFQVAKGKIDKGEDIKTGAFREAQEELGLFVGNINRETKLGTFLGRIHVYLARIKDKGMFGDPDNETGAVKWMTLDEFLSVGRGLHKPIIRAAHRWISKNENINE